MAIAVMAPVALVVWLYSAAPEIMNFWRFLQLNRKAGKIARTQSHLARLARRKAVLARQEAVACLEGRDWTASKAVADAFEEAKRLHLEAREKDLKAREELAAAQQTTWQTMKKIGKERDNEKIIDSAFATYEIWSDLGVQRQNTWKGVEKAWKRVVWKCG